MGKSMELGVVRLKEAKDSVPARAFEHRKKSQQGEPRDSAAPGGSPEEGKAAYQLETVAREEKARQMGWPSRFCEASGPASGSGSRLEI